MNKQQDALKNVTVLDLTRLAGPLCTQSWVIWEQT